jgi:ABC-type uncharacterized transport system permease subunit
MIHSSLLPGIAACLFYLAAFAAQMLSLHDDIARARWSGYARWLAPPALLLHLLNLYVELFGASGFDIGLFNAMSLFFWIAATICYLASLRWPMASLLLIVYPLTIAALSSAMFLHSPFVPLRDLPGGIALHIGLSLLGYGVFGLAAVQAAALGLLIRRLKHHQLQGMSAQLPPLQTMERLLFRMIWIGEALLLAAIASGAIFLENMFAQHLVHKTILSILAWLVFAVLLWGRHRLGWRGMTAVKWTLSGFLLLILAYFGSKLVLELILHRPAA